MNTEPTFQQVRKIKPTRLSVSGLLPFKDGVSIPYESTLERDFLLYFTYMPGRRNCFSTYSYSVCEKWNDLPLHT